MDLGGKIKQMRNQLGLTQEELAAKNKTRAQAEPIKEEKENETRKERQEE